MIVFIQLITDDFLRTPTIWSKSVIKLSFVHTPQQVLLRPLNKTSTTSL